MIPKVIHYCWFGGAPKPHSVLRCIKSWKKYCPDFEIREWTEQDLNVFENEFAKQAYEAKSWSFVSDYFRLWIIYNHGGIYLDTDVQVVRDLTPLLEHKAYFGFERDEFVNTGNGFGAEKEHAVIKAHMEVYDALCFINEDGSYNKIPSPHHTTACLRQYGLTRDTGKIQDLGNVVVYPKEYFCPKSFQTGVTTVTKNTYSIHQFDATWFDETKQKAKKERWNNARKKARKARLVQYLSRLLGEKGFTTLKRLLWRGKSNG